MGKMFGLEDGNEASKDTGGISSIMQFNFFIDLSFFENIKEELKLEEEDFNKLLLEVNENIRFKLEYYSNDFIRAKTWHNSKYSEDDMYLSGQSIWKRF